MKKKIKEERRTVGKCSYCEDLVYSDQQFEVLFCSRPMMWEHKYREGLLHKACIPGALKRFNKELMRDIEAMQNLVEAFVNTGKDKKENKRVGDIENGNGRINKPS